MSEREPSINDQSPDKESDPLKGKCDTLDEKNRPTAEDEVIVNPEVEMVDGSSIDLTSENISTLLRKKILTNIKVKRSSGDIESDWSAVGATEDGEVIVVKKEEGGDIIYKRISLKRLEELNRGEGKVKEAPEDNLPEETDMSDEAKKKYENLPEKGKSIFNKILDRVSSIPGLSKMVTRIAVSWEEYVAKGCAKKMAKNEEKMKAIGLVIDSYEELKAELEEQILEHEKENLPGIDSLKSKISEIEENITKESNRKKEASAEFDKAKNEASGAFNERDKIIDRMSEIYGEKLAPLEKELSTLEKSKNDLDLLDSVTKARHQRMEKDIAKIKKEEDNLKALLRRAGISDEEGGLTEKIRRREKQEEQIKKEKENLRKKREKINKDIAGKNKEATKYRDEIKNLTKIKEGKSLETILEENKVEKDKKPEKKKVSKREEELSEGEINKWFKITEIIKDWNDYIKGEFDQGREELLLGDSFITEANLDNDEEFTLDNFKKILGVYGKNEGVDDIGDIINQYKSKLE